MAPKHRIKRGLADQGRKIKANSDTPNYDDMPIVFSLERVQNGKYCYSRLGDEDKLAFGEQIFKRKNLRWKEIYKAHRHGLGSEKINVTSINPTLPPFITEDKKTLLSLRYKGKNPMVGYRQGNVFYVLWFDYDFSVYDHS